MFTHSAVGINNFLRENNLTKIFANPNLMTITKPVSRTHAHGNARASVRVRVCTRRVEPAQRFAPARDVKEGLDEYTPVLLCLNLKSKESGDLQ